MQRPNSILSLVLVSGLLACPASDDPSPDAGLVPTVQTFGAEGDACAGDAECQRDLYCREDVCRPGDCDLERPCEPWQDCQQGLCLAKSCDLLTPCPHLRPCVEGQCLNCTEDTQCANTEVCHGSGHCQADCDGETPCPDAFVCEGGRCMPLVCDDATDCDE